MINLSYEIIGDYLNNNIEILQRVVRENKISVLHANHAVLMSVVAEAGSLVFLEAMASGCFPVGTYFGGMAASIDSVSGSIPEDVSDWMKLNPDEDELVDNIVLKTKGALTVDDSYKKILHEIAVEKYDWQNISKRLASDLYGLSL